jgi:hypothetical protein
MKYPIDVSKSCFFCEIKVKISFYNDNSRYIVPFDADASYKYSNVCNLRQQSRRRYDMLLSLAQTTQLNAEYIHKNLLLSSLSKYLK